MQIIGKMESLYAEISDIVDRMELKSKLSTQESSDSSEVQSHIMQLKELIQKERSDYIVSAENNLNMINMLFVIVHLYMVPCLIFTSIFNQLINFIGFAETFHDGTFATGDDFC